MALATFTDLQTAVGNWMARADMSGDAADFITLGEAGLNREIPAVETDVTLTGTTDSRRIDISAQSVVAALNLYLVDSSGEEIELVRKQDGTFPYTSMSNQPRMWAIDGEGIDFDCPLDDDYTFRFRIRQRYALSDLAPTNWLLTNHPDVYLAATLIWGGVFVRDPELASTFKQILDFGVPSVKSIISQQNRGTLQVDAALLAPRGFNFTTGV